MSLIQESHDSLPCTIFHYNFELPANRRADIDGDLTSHTRTQISTLLAAELPPDYSTTPHPLLFSLSEPEFSPLITAEIDRIAVKESLTAIDISRYEALSPPSPPTSPKSDSTHLDLLAAWHSTLQKAYASSSYLATRQSNLALLEQFGKNAWLVGNSKLEDILKVVEKELVETREAVEETNKARKGMQEGLKGEMEGLEESWRKGVGRVLEVEIAAEALRRETLERRRDGAI
ncbi:hypothetical protein MMC06_006543 [Schaereria dolodes]|nr:hypothetical protein [Schaereria dolodes]